MTRSQLASLLAVVALLAGCGGDDGEEAAPPPPPEPTTTEAAPAGDFETYDVSSEGFSIAVPASWQAISTDELDEEAIEELGRENPALAPYLEPLRRPNSPMKFIAIDPNIQQGFATNVNVIVEELPGDVGLEEYTEANVSQIEQVVELEGPLDRTEVDLPAGTATRLQYEAQLAVGGEARPFALVQYLLAEEGSGYVITFTTLPDLVAEYEDDFEASAESFRTGAG